MVTKQSVRKAGHEIGDLVVLVIDQVPNRQQITQFTTEGFEAITAIAAVGIPKEEKAAVATHLAEAILERLNETVLTLPAA